MRLRLPTVPVRWAIGIFLFIAVLAWFTAPNPNSNRDVADPFVGRWLVNGEDSFGKEYSGSLSIAVGDGQYSLDWIVTGAIISGKGSRNDAVLEVVWTRGEDERRASGTAQYTIDAAGNLVGTIRTDGANGRGSEVAERVPG